MARELTIEIRAESQQAEDAFARVEDRLKGVEQTADKAGDRVDDFGESAGGAAKEATTFGRALEKIGGPAGVAALAGAGLAIATKYAVDFTANIAKAARHAEISTDAMQGLDAVARKNGSTFDVLSKAMFDLDVKLSKGGKNVIGIVEGMGESVDDLLKMSRDDRFRAVAKAIVSIEDPAERSRAAVELLGGQAQDLMGVLKDLADEADKDAPRLSSAFVRAGDEIKRAFDSMFDAVLTRGSQFLAELMLWPVVLSNWSRDVSQALWQGPDPLASSELPRLPGRPSAFMPSGALPGFDPLNGQSMGFLERQLTQGARPGRSTGPAPVVPYSPLEWLSRYTNPQALVSTQRSFMGPFGGFAFPGWAPGPLASTGLNYADPSMWNGTGMGMLRGTVPMNAPGVGGGGGFFRGTGGRLLGMGAGMLSGLIPGMSGTGSAIGSGVGSAIGSIGKIASSTFGAFLGPLGGIAGGLLGKVFGGLFNSQGRQTNRLRDSTIRDDFGSVDALREAAEKAGFSVDKLLSTGKIETFKAEYAKLVKAISDTEADAQRVDEAMQRWGLTIEDMGPKFKQTKINDAFKEATDDMRVLTDAGADFDVVAGKMAPHFGALIQDAIEMGVQVPRELQPIIAKMIDMGILVDKNGDKFTELGQVPFAQDLNKDFQTLIDKMDKLIARISELPGLFDRATDAAGDFADAAPGGGPPGGGGGGDAGGFTSGGVVGRGYRQASMADTLWARVRPGEVVLTPEQARGGVSVSIGNISVGAGASRGQTAEMVGEAVVAYMERRGVRWGRRVA